MRQSGFIVVLLLEAIGCSVKTEHSHCGSSHRNDSCRMSLFFTEKDIQIDYDSKVVFEYRKIIHSLSPDSSKGNIVISNSYDTTSLNFSYTETPEYLIASKGSVRDTILDFTSQRPYHHKLKYPPIIGAQTALLRDTIISIGDSSYSIFVFEVECHHVSDCKWELYYLKNYGPLLIKQIYSGNYLRITKVESVGLSSEMILPLMQKALSISLK